MEKSGQMHIPAAITSGKINSSEGKAIPVEAYYGPIGFQGVEATIFLDNRHKKVVRF
jgi:hypothetical protein